MVFKDSLLKQCPAELKQSPAERKPEVQQGFCYRVAKGNAFGVQAEAVMVGGSVEQISEDGAAQSLCRMDPELVGTAGVRAESDHGQTRSGCCRTS